MKVSNSELVHEDEEEDEEEDDALQGSRIQVISIITL